ncbi:MAG: NAD(P)/FAD-dependent oxidoreductase [Burkholderiaceae bacterium]|nr:NAD(P)/FAD-dependent oxidoreductase [Burkholderiaceae bacterium]
MVEKIDSVDRVDCVVIGAGVVGLAVARALALSPKFAGREVMVLEAASAIGTGTSSRNSEVIHAGIYYPQGSLKAQLCVQGRAMLYDYCAERGIGFKRCGKLIVATQDAQVAQLQGIIAKAAANGVHDLVLLTRDEARALEPQLECVAAVLSPSTGIVDSHALMLALQGDLENAGGMVVLNSTVESATVIPSNTTLAGVLYAKYAIKIVANDGAELVASTVVNAAGLHAPALARRFAGLDPALVPPDYYAKGNYFTLSGRSPFERLIYPVPEAAGLGVHLTLDLGGQAKFGPDVQWVDSPDDLVVDPARGDAFYAEVRKYWPNLQDGALIAGYAGIRPKINAPHEVAKDFMIQGPKEHGVAGLVNLFGIESPGLTSSLAIGARVAEMLA